MEDMRKIREIVRAILKEWSPEQHDITEFKVKEIISEIPPEIKDIFDLCKNEIQLSNNDVLMTGLYTKIFYDCLLSYYKLTHGQVDIIGDVRKYFTKSNNENEVKHQYKTVLKPSHIFSAELLKMITDYKKMEFVDERLSKYKASDTIYYFIEGYFTGKSIWSKTHANNLLNAKVKFSD